MSHSPTAPEARAHLWTAGHSTYEQSDFVALLQGAEIETVVDVRSTPYSAHARQFNRPQLETLLAGADIEYRWEGDGLGGRPEGDAYYDEQGHALYGAIAQTKEFVAAIDRLIALATEGRRVALVCVEEDPLGCHRSWFLTRALSERGIGVTHIRGDGRQQTATELESERRHGQEALFDPVEEVWRSPNAIPRRRGTDIDDL